MYFDKEREKMTHWGWYWKVKRKHRAKNLCDNQTCIDSFDLFNQNNFSGFTITSGEKEEVRGTLQGLQIIVSSDTMSYTIPIEKQACHFGGFRYFFRCPVSGCDRRMRKLYVYDCYFACRKCLNLGYLSQKVVSSRRFYLMGKKIKQRLENSGGNLYTKPKWMRSKTFNELQRKEASYQIKSEFALEDEIINMYGHPF
jgi:hypothetical protein